ncbi:phosphoglycerate mutase [Metamycoplasma alkalescens]|nr:phosphoglycerate mutase [Metamycoplasma alkalescens]
MFICSDKKIKLQNGSLSDVAPTILDYLDFEIPNEMNGKSLLQNN